jgi:hypothetical protein
MFKNKKFRKIRPKNSEKHDPQKKRKNQKKPDINQKTKRKTEPEGSETFPKLEINETHWILLG